MIMSELCLGTLYVEREKRLIPPYQADSGAFVILRSKPTQILSITLKICTPIQSIGRGYSVAPIGDGISQQAKALFS